MKKIVTTLSVGFSMSLLTMPVLADPQANFIVHRGGGWRGAVGGTFETSHREYVNVQNRFEDDIGFRIVRTYPIQ